jgi:hypothetical protein
LRRKNDVANRTRKRTRSADDGEPLVDAALAVFVENVFRHVGVDRRRKNNFESVLQRWNIFETVSFVRNFPYLGHPEREREREGEIERKKVREKERR